MDNKQIVEAFNLKGTKSGEILEDKLNELFPERLKITECLDNVRAFIAGDIDEKKYEEGLNKLRIRTYLPIIDKMSLIMQLINIMNISNSVMDGEAVITELYKNVFYKVILEGYGQINLLDGDYQTYDNYDLLYPTYGYYIKMFCNEDFKVFMDMLRDSLSFNGIFNLIEKVKNIDEEEMKKNTKEIKNLLNGLKEDKNLITNLSTIVTYNDPIYNKVRKEMLKEAKEDIKEESKNNEDIKVVK